jgi:protein SCO1
MKLSLRGKIALASFVLFDLFLAAYLFNLYGVSKQRDEIATLREIGVSIYPDQRKLSDFSLVDQNGAAFSNANLDGRWSLIFFGFTSCPDICPLTMTELEQFYRSLEASERQDLSIILVSVDPTRDGPAEMDEYIKKYHEDFFGLTGDFEVISALADDLFVVHELAGSEGDEGHGHTDHTEQLPPEGKDYLINHSGHISVINPEGTRFAVMRPPHRDGDIMTAFRSIKNF